MEKIKNVPIGSIVPYELNNKIHDQSAVDRVANSISEFGWTYPILIDEQNIILAGHKRLLAAKKLGLKEVPVIIKEGLTAAQKKAYRIIDNKSSQESSWDLPNIELELSSLDEAGFDLEPFILNDFEIGKLESSSSEESKYTGKTNIPPYEKPEKKPDFDDVYQSEYAKQLVGKIEASNCTAEEKRFLIMAAHRHVVFNYTKVADYYTFATPEMQRLMEDSALVIVDMDQAISNGWTRFNNSLDELFTTEFEEKKAK